MADGDTGDKPADAPAATATADTPDTPDVSAQAQNPDAVKRALDAERSTARAEKKRADAAEAKVREHEEANSSELEKAQVKVTKAEQAKAAAETRLLRYEVAAAKQIPADAIDLLNGTSQEELEASADKILALVKSRNDNETPDFDGGARETAGTPKTPEQEHNETVLALMGLKPNP